MGIDVLQTTHRAVVTRLVCPVPRTSLMIFDKWEEQIVGEVKTECVWHACHLGDPAAPRDESWPCRIPVHVRWARLRPVRFVCWGGRGGRLPALRRNLCELHVQCWRASLIPPYVERVGETRVLTFVIGCTCESVEINPCVDWALSLKSSRRGRSFHGILVQGTPACGKTTVRS